MLRPPNRTIVVLVLKHTRLYLRSSGYLADIELGGQIPLSSPQIPLGCALGYLGWLERYLSSSFDIVKISLGLFCWNTTRHPKCPSALPRGIWGDLWYFRPNTSLFSNVLVRFHIKLISSPSMPNVVYKTTYLRPAHVLEYSNLVTLVPYGLLWSLKIETTHPKLMPMNWLMKESLCFNSSGNYVSRTYHHFL